MEENKEKTELKENELEEVSGGLRMAEGLIAADRLLIDETCLVPFKENSHPRAVFSSVVDEFNCWEDFNINKH